jgi:hypothetical protein
VFSSLSVPMVAHATMEYVMALLRNKCTATVEQCFLCGSCQDVISRIVSSGVSGVLSGVGWLVQFVSGELVGERVSQSTAGVKSS